MPTGKHYWFGYPSISLRAGFGGVMDAATNLIYVGNGQYYDPATGRFLTRDAQPDKTNPYVPWNPTGAIIGPLALLGLIYSRRRKRSKWDTLFIFLVLGGAVAMSMSACGGTPTLPAPNPTSIPDNSAPAVPPGTPTPGGPGTVEANLPSATSAPIDTPMPTPCATAIFTTPTPSPSLEQVYNIIFIEDGMKWDAHDKDSALKAVEAVALKLSGILGGSAVSAWAETFGYMNFQMGNCADCVKGGEHAGHTSGAHKIEFAGISDTGEKGRNLVVHELGHAFKWLLYNKTKIDVYTELTDWRGFHPGYPDRGAFNGGPGDTGPSSGFASLQNQTLWQVSLEGGDDEEFADQFLGWTFNMWETDDITGLIAEDGQARADMMNANMPNWVTSSAGP